MKAADECMARDNRLAEEMAKDMAEEEDEKE